MCIREKRTGNLVALEIRRRIVAQLRRLPGNLHVLQTLRERAGRRRCRAGRRRRRIGKSASRSSLCRLRIILARARSRKRAGRVASELVVDACRGADQSDDPADCTGVLMQGGYQTAHRTESLQTGGNDDQRTGEQHTEDAADDKTDKECDHECRTIGILREQHGDHRNQQTDCADVSAGREKDSDLIDTICQNRASDTACEQQDKCDKSIVRGRSDCAEQYSADKESLNRRKNPEQPVSEKALCKADHRVNQEENGQETDHCLHSRDISAQRVQKIPDAVIS